jgi:hypothetical protein
VRTTTATTCVRGFGGLDWLVGWLVGWWFGWFVGLVGTQHAWRSLFWGWFPGWVGWLVEPARLLGRSVDWLGGRGALVRVRAWGMDVSEWSVLAGHCSARTYIHPHPPHAYTQVDTIDGLVPLVPIALSRLGVASERAALKKDIKVSTGGATCLSVCLLVSNRKKTEREAHDMGRIHTTKMKKDGRKRTQVRRIHPSP